MAAPDQLKCFVQKVVYFGQRGLADLALVVFEIQSDEPFGLLDHCLFLGPLFETVVVDVLTATFALARRHQDFLSARFLVGITD